MEGQEVVVAERGVEGGVGVDEGVFQTDLPCFQKQDGERLFDPLDAMRRDAHREVVLWLEMLPEDKGREEGE